MSTHPFIPLYVDDYDSHTAHLTAEEDGVYGRLLRLCWRTPGCSLPNDPAWIARKIRLSIADFERVARPVIDEFFTVLRGRLVQRRLKDEYDNISRKKSARKLAGKMGGEAKARKTKDKPASIATVLPAHTRAFPEPEPEPKERTPLPPLLAAVAESAPQRAAKGTRLPPDWLPSARNREYAASKGFGEIAISTMAEKFRNYWAAKPGAAAIKISWDMTWQNWVINEFERRPVAAQAPRQSFV